MTSPLKRYPIGSFVICRLVHGRQRFHCARLAQHKAEGISLVRTYDPYYARFRHWGKTWQHEILGMVAIDDAKDIEHQLGELAETYHYAGDIIVPDHLRAVLALCQP